MAGDPLQKWQELADQVASLQAKLGPDQALQRTAALAAGACLQLAAARVEWPFSHALVEDQGVRAVRKAVLEGCAESLQLATDALRALAVHGGLGHVAATSASRLEELSDLMKNALAGLENCEALAVRRIRDPCEAGLELEARMRSLRADPSTGNLELAQLASEVARAEEQHREKQQEHDALDARLREERRCADGLEARARELGDELDRESKRISALRKEIEKLHGAIVSTRGDLESAEADEAQLRAALSALESDPRADTRRRVAAAHRALAPGGA